MFCCILFCCWHDFYSSSSANPSFILRPSVTLVCLLCREQNSLEYTFDSIMFHVVHFEESKTEQNKKRPINVWTEPYYANENQIIICFTFKMLKLDSIINWNSPEKGIFAEQRTNLRIKLRRQVEKTKRTTRDHFRRACRRQSGGLWSGSVHGEN